MHTDVKKELKLQRSQRRVNGTARDDAVYQQLKCHDHFDLFHDRGVHWLLEQLSCKRTTKAVWIVTCKSGRHRSVALIRSIAESHEIGRTGLDVVQIDSAELTHIEVMVIARLLRNEKEASTMKLCM